MYGLYLMLFVLLLRTMPEVPVFKDYMFLALFIAAGALYGYPENKKGKNDD